MQLCNEPAGSTRPVALVTGSSRGIGRAIAVALAERNFRVILHGRACSDHLEETARQIRSRNGVVEQVVFDLEDLSPNSKYIEQVFNAFGAIHCLVNNAGTSVRRRGDILEVQEDSFEEQYRTNMRGTFFLTQAVARRMLTQDRRCFHSIINITSSNAELASIDRSEYCMAKSALAMMAKLFAVRLAPEGINVYEIRPGLIRTDMTRVAADRYDAKLAAGFTPINRWGEPCDVGAAVAPIAEGAFRFATGDVFHIDGGMALQHY
jgi:3-oxoacyl-[acyl-carrier protein] reductase